MSIYFENMATRIISEGIMELLRFRIALHG